MLVSPPHVFLQKHPGSAYYKDVRVAGIFGCCQLSWFGSAEPGTAAGFLIEDRRLKWAEDSDGTFFWANYSDRSPPVGHPKWWWKVRESPKNPRNNPGLGWFRNYCNLPRFLLYTQGGGPLRSLWMELWGLYNWPKVNGFHWSYFIPKSVELWPPFISVFTLRIQVCPIGKGLPRSIPMLFGWDWNPKNPLLSGGIWILRVSRYVKSFESFRMLLSRCNV